MGRYRKVEIKKTCFVSRHEGLSESRGIAPLILNLGTDGSDALVYIPAA